jgi:hypothetical protein
MTKRAFISQPMMGRSIEDILAEREPVVAKLMDDGYFVHDSMFTNDPYKGVNRDAYLLGRSIQLIAQSDLVVFLSGWGQAKGCVLEHEVCL